MKQNTLTYLPLIVGGIVLALLISFLSATSSIHDVYIEDVKQELLLRSSLLTPYYEAIIDGEELDIPEDVLKATRLTIIEDNGDVIWDSQASAQNMSNHGTRPEVLSSLNSREPSFSMRYSTTVNKKLLYCSRVIEYNGGEYVVRTAISLANIDEVLALMRRNVILEIGLAIVLIALLAYGILITITRPINRLVFAAKQISSGELKTKLPIPRRGAVRELAVSLSIMTSQLTRNINRVSRSKNERDAMFASLSEGVILLDKSGKIIRINAAAIKIFDFGSRALVGQDFFALLRKDSIEKFIQASIENPNHSYQKEFQINLPSGTRHVRLRAIGLDWGDDSGVMVVSYNLTQMRKLESYRSDFVANVSHEIKTPLTAIQCAVETLQDGAIDDPDASQRFLEIIASHGSRLNSLVEDLLSLSNLECQQVFLGKDSKEQVDPIDFVSTAVELCRPVAKRRSSTITINNQTTELKVIGNRRVLEQMMINLIDNAIKYSNPNDEINVNLSQDNNYVAIKIIDHGAGISQEHLSRLFERFYRVDKSRSRDAGGTGLGLAIVKHTAQIHGGTVGVESTLGKGTTFTIRLPIG